MAFPILLQKLFQNGGSGPELRQDIIPKLNSSQMPADYLEKSGGDVVGNLTVQSKNVVRSVNGTYANDNGNVTLSGLVKSVNGTAADASGNVTVDVSLTKDKVVNALGYTPPTTNTTYSSGTGISVGSDNTINLANSGVSAGSYGPSANVSPAHSGTFTVPYVTVDAKGRVTGASNKTITLPAVTLPSVGEATYVERANYTNITESKHTYNNYGTTTNSNTGGMSSPTYVYKYYTAAKRDAYGRLTGVGVWTYKSYCNCNCQD